MKLLLGTRRFRKKYIVGLCAQDYKCLLAAVMICAIVVNTQTDTQTDKERETKNFNRSATLTS